MTGRNDNKYPKTEILNVYLGPSKRHQDTINCAKDLLEEIPVKKKGGVEEGDPSDYNPSQNL